MQVVTTYKKRNFAGKDSETSARVTQRVGVASPGWSCGGTIWVGYSDLGYEHSQWCEHSL